MHGYASLYTHFLLAIPYLYILHVCIMLRPFVRGTNPAGDIIHHIHHYQTITHKHRTRWATPDSHAIQMTNLGPLATKYATVWNNIPKDIRAEEDETFFRKKLRIHLLELQHKDTTLFTL